MKPDRARPHRYWAGWHVDERRMLLGRALRFPVEPIEGESLIGMVVRTTDFHVLGEVCGVLRRAGISMYHPGWLSKIEPEKLVALAPIIGCGQADILSRATPLLNPDAVNSDIMIAGSVISSVHTEHGRRRISPLSLRASPHHREAWLIQLLPYCPESLELLRSDCSRCGAPLRWLVAQGIGRCDAPSCAAIVEPTDAAPLESELAADYRLFADLVCARGARRVAALAQIAEPLAALNSQELINMLVELGACLHHPAKRVDRKTFHRLPAPDLAAICSIGTRLTRSWPTGFRAWVDGEADRLAGDQSALLELRATIRRLGHRARVGDAQADLVQGAFPDLFGNVQRSFAPSDQVMLRVEASELLGIDATTLHHLATIKVLVSERMGSGGRHARFRRSVILDLKRRLGESASFALIRRTLGLPSYAVEHLMHARNLVSEDHPAIAELRGDASITTASVMTLAQALERRRKKGERPANLLPIGTATRHIGGRLKPWQALIAGLRDGSLPFWAEGPIDTESNLARAVLIRADDIRRFEQVCIAPLKPGPSRTIELCSIEDAREILNLLGSPSISLPQVFADDIASRSQSGPLITVSMEAVLAEAQATISMAEICARAGWNPRQAKWALAPFAAHRTACGWDRTIIETSGILAAQIDWNLRAHRRPSRTLDRDTL